MSKDAPKRIHASNEKILKTLRVFALVCLILSLGVLAGFRAKLIRKVVALVALHGASWVALTHLARVSAPVYNAGGALIRVGCDLAAPGYVEAVKDIVLACAAIAVLVPLAPWLAFLGPVPALVSVIRDLRGAMRTPK
eukprot:gnl/Chilomastix_caulleri/1892.p2 GENE.gnl/Chilomastix_caulleri/1892~~gnl/Chilomastix_caulleri/1892.p2  ORF type:complete len:138 (+),score=19.50 gnl/Chilomastix_caulleri/1892:60-473(+)